MDCNNKKLQIESMSWYEEFIALVSSQGTERIRKVLKKFDESFFFSYQGFDRDLLELVRREYEDQSGNPLKSVLNASHLAQEILYRYAHLIKDELLYEYKNILVGKVNTFIVLLSVEKEKREKLADFLKNYFPKFS